MNICRDRTIKALCDLEITGNNEDPPVLANSVFLFGVSEKWNELILSAENKKVFIPQISREIMDDIITYIYSEDRNSQLLGIDDGNFGKYCQASKFLQMDDIKDHCLKYLASQSITMDNYFAFFELYRAFGIDATKKKMTKFLTQNAQQIPDIVRRSKNELHMSESEISLVIIDWLPESGGESCGLDLELVVQEFSNKEEKEKLLEAFHDVGDREWKDKAFLLVRNLYKNGDDTLQSDSNSSRHHQHDQNQGQNSMRTEGNQRPQISKAATASTSSSQSSSLHKRRRVDNSTDSIPNSDPDNNNNNSDLDSSFEGEMENDNNNNLNHGSKSHQSASSCSSPSPLVLEASPTPSLASSSSSSSLPWLPMSQRERIPEGIIYFLLKKGSCSEEKYLWSFNIQDHHTRQEVKLPGVFCNHKNPAMLFWNDSIYLMGGESTKTGRGTAQVHVFRLQSQDWLKKVNKMNVARFDFKACVLNRDIYAIGGCKKTSNSPLEFGNGVNTAEKLSFQTSDLESKWDLIDCMKNCRADAGVDELNGKIYAIGGCVGTKKTDWKMRASNLCEVFDPTIPKPQHQWNPIAPMKFKRMGLVAVATTTPNRIYALGGSPSFPSATNPFCPKPHNTVEIYDPDQDAWTIGPPMLKHRTFFSAFFCRNCIYVLGGDSDGEPTMEKLDLRTQKWTLEAELMKDGNFSTVAFK